MFIRKEPCSDKLRHWAMRSRRFGSWALEEYYIGCIYINTRAPSTWVDGEASDVPTNLPPL